MFLTKKGFMFYKFMKLAILSDYIFICWLVCPQCTRNLLSIEGTDGIKHNFMGVLRHEEFNNNYVENYDSCMHRVCIRKIQRTTHNSPMKSDQRGQEGTEK